VRDGRQADSSGADEGRDGGAQGAAVRKASESARGGGQRPGARTVRLQAEQQVRAADVAEADVAEVSAAVRLPSAEEEQRRSGGAGSEGAAGGVAGE